MTPPIVARGEGQLRGSALLLAAQLAAAAGAFVMTIVVARSLGPAGRGEYAFAITAAVFISIFSHGGLSSALWFYGARHPWAQRRLVTLYLATAAITTGPLTIATWLAVGAITSGTTPLFNERSGILVLAAVALSSSLFDGTVGIQLAARRFWAAAVTSVLSTVLPAAYAIAAAAAGGLTVRGALLATAAARALVSVVGLWAMLRTAIPRPAREKPLTSRTIFDYSGRSFFAVLSGVLTARADQWVLGIMAGPAPLGFYAVSVSMSDPLQHVTSAAQRGYSPHIAVDSGSGAEMTDRTVRGLLVALILGSLVLVPTALLLLPLLFGPEFTASREPFLALLPGSFGLGLLAIYSVALRSTGAPGLSSVVEMATGGMMIALDLVLIGPLGATGAAIAASTAYIAGGVLAMRLFHRRCHDVRPGAFIPRGDDFARAGRMVTGALSDALGRRAAGRPDG
jgi:O-antigen/teichoic acid export membrane protein